MVFEALLDEKAKRGDEGGLGPFTHCLRDLERDTCTTAVRASFEFIIVAHRLVIAGESV